MGSFNSTHTVPIPKQTSQRLVIIILTIAFMARVGAALYLGNTVSGLSGAHDEISYSMLGQRFATGHDMTFPSQWYPWIEPDSPQSYYSYTISLMLAGIYSVFGYYPIIARLVMAILSTFVVLMIYLVGKRFFNEPIALIASGIAAVYAYLVFYGVTLVTETPFILALLVAIYASFRILDGETHGKQLLWWGMLGTALAIAVLLRMAVVFFLPFFFAWIAFRLPNWQERSYILVPIGFIVLAVLPLTVRNYQLWDRFLLLESQFGHVFWNGNHPGHNGDFHPYEVFPIPSQVLSSKNDAIITNELLRMGIANVLADPGDFLRLTVTRFREFFTFWPTTDSTLQANLLRVLSFGAILPLAVSGLIWNFRNWRSLIIIYLFILVHTGVYVTSWTMIRYRLPIDVFLILFAASAVWVGIEAWRRRSGRTSAEVATSQR